MNFDYTIAAGVLLATAATDAVFVMFSSAVAGKRPLAAANWSSVWYLLSAFAVINFTSNWLYVFVAAGGSWIGAYVSLKLLHRSRASASREERLQTSWGRDDPVRV